MVRRRIHFQEDVAMAHKSLIEQVCGGKSAKYIIDAIMEELPPLPAIRTSLIREIPKAAVRIEENTFFISPPEKNDKYKMQEIVETYRLMYPEIEFVIK